MEGAAMEGGASSQPRLIQMLTASTARGGDAALRGQGGVVRGGASGRPEVLLGQPDVAQWLVTGAAHGRSQGYGAFQGAVLLAATTGQNCGETRTKVNTGTWYRNTVV